MRIRTIKPEFFKHEGVFELEKETGLPIRIAFIGIWCVCDREGRFKWRPRQLKADILPYDDTVDFSRVLDACLTRGLLVRYRVGDEWFGAVPSFLKHQIINNREKPSEIPDVSMAEQLDASSTRAPRVPHAGTGEGKGREGKEIEREGQRLHGIPISPEEVIEYGKQCNPLVEEATCRAFFAHYEGQRRTGPNGAIFWITGSETVVTNWKAKLPAFQPPRNPRPQSAPARNGGGRYANPNI